MNVSKEGMNPTATAFLLCSFEHLESTCSLESVPQSIADGLFFTLLMAADIFRQFMKANERHLVIGWSTSCGKAFSTKEQIGLVATSAVSARRFFPELSSEGDEAQWDPVLQPHQLQLVEADSQSFCAHRIVDGPDVKSDFSFPGE
ncbi:hypothetical protein AVEN_167562-1 [Araneus ventricosus]|uniref:Uncharacterized protein n=1 Tax=Araneus ventricosus TaxID=182803 RepID=A0A4Y2LWC6_ARAVE|nr:hypothetical protein AVEN_174583-1 [Araneus ventricosus]GBN18373.1 hypothetical protein AVEN_167562-1 [Araneus ventricosus]